MKKIFILILLCTYGCGYQPIYLNKGLKDYEFYKINLKGNNQINKQIINSLSISEDKLNKDLNELFLLTNLKTIETSKDSKGKILSYRTTIYVDFKIKKNDKIIKSKEIIKDISYGNKENKFELVEYQNQITSNLASRAAEEIILFLNLE
jgi:hypothetical protein